MLRGAQNLGSLLCLLSAPLSVSVIFALSPGPFFTTLRSARFLWRPWTLITENPCHQFSNSLPIFILEPLSSIHLSLSLSLYLHAPHLQTYSALFELVHFSSFTFSPPPLFFHSLLVKAKDTKWQSSAACAWGEPAIPATSKETRGL